MADWRRTLEVQKPNTEVNFAPRVIDKNFYWFNRYRVTDGFSTYGERAFLKFSEYPKGGGYGDGLSNYCGRVSASWKCSITLTSQPGQVVVWATAQGKTVKPIDDSNLAEVPQRHHQQAGDAARRGQASVPVRAKRPSPR